MKKEYLNKNKYKQRCIGCHYEKNKADSKPCNKCISIDYLPPIIIGGEISPPRRSDKRIVRKFYSNK
jgi:hypothetical protein